MTRRAVRAAILIAIPWGIAGAACGKQFNDEPAPPEGQRLITGKLYPPAVRDLAEQAVALQLAAVAIDGREDDPITAFAAGPAFNPSGNGGQPVSFRIALTEERSWVLVLQSPVDGRGRIGRLVALVRFPRARTGELSDVVSGLAGGATVPLADLDLGVVRIASSGAQEPGVAPAATRQVLLGEGESANPLALNDAEGDGVPDVDDGDDDNDLIPDDGDDDANGDGIPDAAQAYAALRRLDVDGDQVPDVFQP